MDLAVLLLVNAIMRIAATIPRLLLSATFGACWSIAAIMIPPTYKLVVNICTYILIGPLMIRMCTGNNNIKCIVKGTAVLLTVSIFIGGCIHFLYYNTYAGYIIRSLLVSDGELIVFALVSLLLIILLLRWFLVERQFSASLRKIKLVVGSDEVEINAIIDTGNGLTDPVTGKPVMVVEKKAVSDILNNINDYTKVKYHVIPFRSVGCDSGIIEVITVDIMYIYNREKTTEYENVLMGLTDIKLSSKGIFSALINPQIYTGNEGRESEF